jgi:hypothetical protein
MSVFDQLLSHALEVGQRTPSFHRMDDDLVLCFLYFYQLAKFGWFAGFPFANDLGVRLEPLTIFPGNCVSPLNTRPFACLTTCRIRLAISVSAVVSG